MTIATAEHLFTRAVPTCKSDDLAGHVLGIIQSSISSFESVDYIYVLDENKLIGVFSIHELFSANPSATVAEIMINEVAYAHLHTDQQHIAQLALAQSIKAVPVVDDSAGFLGVVLADTVLQILNEHHSNYLFKVAGIRRKKNIHHSELGLLEQVKTRMPWLILGLLGGLVGAAIINYFERSLSEALFVAAFIPAIVYIADAVGNQSEMLVVRALGHERDFSIKRYLSRELKAGLLISILLGTLMFVLSYVWLRDEILSTTLGTAIVATTMFSIMFTVTLPWALRRLGFDPAVASGPLATVICDVSSVTIYLLTASALL